MAEAGKLDLELEGDPRHNYQTFLRKYDKPSGKRGTLAADPKEQTFEENVKYIVAHNKKYLAGETSYCLGVNQFADLTHDEIKKMFNVCSTTAQPRAGTFTFEPAVTLPDQVDWSKNTGALEGQHYKAKKELVSLSEQQLVDCCKHAPDGAGNMDTAFE